MTTMTPGLPPDLFSNPIWHALHTRHLDFAIASSDACRYPADMAPFAALAAPTATALQRLATLLAPNESVWLFDEHLPPTSSIHIVETLPCLRMFLPPSVAPPCPAIECLPLTCADAPDMVALTDVAYPGFFRARTCRMGSYFGVRHHGELVAMCGERIMLPGYPELSGLCIHPDHRGHGYAVELIWHLVRKHRCDGEVSWLHVASSNLRAIDLYYRMGFLLSEEISITRVALSA